MGYYVVSYDIDTKNPRDLDGHLVDLEKKGLSCKPLNNLWIVKTTASIKDLYNECSSKLQGNDRLFVSSIPYEYTIFNMIPEARKFLEDNKLIDS